MILFEDRQAAGAELASVLKEKELDNPLIIALARGGVPVGSEVALQMGADFAVWIARRIVSPDNPEFSLGAVAEKDTVLWNEDSLLEHHINKEDIDLWETKDEIREMRGSFLTPLPDVKGRLVILVDDGVSSGWSAKAASRAIYKEGAKSVWGAFPVAKANLKEYFDGVIYLYQPKNFHYISSFYKDFPFVSNQEIVRSLTL